MKIDNSGNVIYRCTTDELTKQFLQECEEQGILWVSGEKPTQNENIWRVYKHRTCFSFKNGRLLYGTLIGMHISHSVLEYLGKDTKSTEELQDEIARLTAENKAYADNILTAIKILQNSDGFKAQTAINQAIGALLGNKDNKWKREIDSND